MAIGITMRFTTIVAALTLDCLLLRDMQATFVAGHEGFNLFGFWRSAPFARGIEPAFDKMYRQPDDKNPD